MANRVLTESESMRRARGSVRLTLLQMRVVRLEWVDHAVVVVDDRIGVGLQIGPNERRGERGGLCACAKQ